MWQMNSPQTKNYYGGIRGSEENWITVEDRDGNSPIPKAKIKVRLEE